MIVVITTARPDGSSHLADTLRAIDSSATSERRVVLVDGDAVPSVPPEWSVSNFQKPPNKGGQNKWVTWRAFELASEAGEDLLFFEDDIALCKGAVRYMERMEVPRDVAFVSLYDPYGGTVDGRPWGLWRARMHVYSYCQALKVPLRTCRILAAGVDEMRETLRFGGSDDTLRDFGRPRNWLYAIHVPGLVQHVGVKSCVGTQGLEGSRVSRSYPGDHFNALSLRHWQFD